MTAPRTHSQPEGRYAKLLEIADNIAIGKITVAHISPVKAECDRVRRLIVRALRQAGQSRKKT